MSVTVRCPKCGGNADATRTHTPFGPSTHVYEMSCPWCGSVRHGDDVLRLVQQAQLARANKNLFQSPFGGYALQERVSNNTGNITAFHSRLNARQNATVGLSYTMTNMVTNADAWCVAAWPHPRARPS